MKTLLKAAVLGTVVAATALTAIPTAQAGDGWRRHGDWGGHRHWRGTRSGDLVAAGVIGLAVGALAAGAANASRGPDYYVYDEPPPPRRYAKRYYVADDDVVYARRGGYSVEPWTQGWYEYCSSRYRSFNARTGTYTGYDGVKRFCNAN